MQRKYKIRRLMPEECFSLMGMREEDVKMARAVGVSETALLKQAGNGVGPQCVGLVMEHLYQSMHDPDYLPKDELESMSLSSADTDEERWQQVELDEIAKGKKGDI